MATKWHPASGNWGIFGETSGSREAKKAEKQISDMISDLEGRSGNITDYYSRVGKLGEDQLKKQTLSQLESFLDESYNINYESEETKANTGFAFLDDLRADEKQKKRREKAEDTIEAAKSQLLTDRLNLGQKEQSELFNLEDLIRNLKLQREDYT